MNLHAVAYHLNIRCSTVKNIDRFYVMKNYSKMLSNQPRIEFIKANKTGKELLKGTHYQVLKNANKLNKAHTEKSKKLLRENTHLNTLYIMKEQLQVLCKSENAKLIQEIRCMVSNSLGVLHALFNKGYEGGFRS